MLNCKTLPRCADLRVALKMRQGAQLEQGVQDATVTNVNLGRFDLAFTDIFEPVERGDVLNFLTYAARGQLNPYCPAFFRFTPFLTICRHCLIYVINCEGVNCEKYERDYCLHHGLPGCLFTCGDTSG
jgi:hypothetical protein